MKEKKKFFEIVNKMPKKKKKKKKKKKNLISCKWIFSYKQNDKGNIIKYNGRLVSERFFTSV